MYHLFMENQLESLVLVNCMLEDGDLNVLGVMLWSDHVQGGKNYLMILSHRLVLQCSKSLLFSALNCCSF